MASFSQLNFRQGASVEVGKSDRRLGGARDLFNPTGAFQVEHWRHGLLLATYNFPNGIVNEGKNSILDVYFDSGTQITTWYMLLIDNANFTALADTDTYDDIDQAGNGWDEYKDYTDPGNANSTTTRPVWNPDPASGESISNSSQTVFDIVSPGGTVKGLGIVGGGVASATKGDNAADGTLWATALFDQGDTVVVNGDQLKITYTVSA